MSTDPVIGVVFWITSSCLVVGTSFNLLTPAFTLLAKLESAPPGLKIGFAVPAATFAFRPAIAFLIPGANFFPAAVAAVITAPTALNPCGWYGARA